MPHYVYGAGERKALRLWYRSYLPLVLLFTAKAFVFVLRIVYYELCIKFFSKRMNERTNERTNE